MEQVSQRLSIEIAVLSGVFSFLLSALILQIPLVDYEIGVFPVAVNINGVISIILGISLAAISVENYRGLDLFHDLEIISGSFLMSLISIFTVGLAVPPFNITPYSLAVASTVGIQAFIFSWFVIPYARDHQYLEKF